MKGVPIYEYECERCQHRFEIMQKLSDRPLKKCEKCGGPVQKVLSAPGLVFKGSGWYVTDYANSDRKKAMKAEKDGAGSNGDKKTDAADSKANTTAPKKDD
ncbi:MAG: FmdB family zinc ribbon protein [candidate division NC10 bacterium]